jgi:hypothetical protein
VNIKRQDLAGEGMFGRKAFGAPDALLPQDFSHAAIMPLGIVRKQLREGKFAAGSGI